MIIAIQAGLSTAALTDLPGSFETASAWISHTACKAMLRTQFSTDCYVAIIQEDLLCLFPFWQLSTLAAGVSHCAHHQEAAGQEDSRYADGYLQEACQGFRIWWKRAIIWVWSLLGILWKVHQAWRLGRHTEQVSHSALLGPPSEELEIWNGTAE